MAWYEQPGQTTVLPTKTQQQQNAINLTLDKATQGLQNLNPSFEPIQQAANRNYATQTASNLTPFLINQGIEPGSSGFSAGHANAFNDFQLKSLAQRAQFEQNQQANLQNLLGTGINAQAFENIYQPPQAGLLQAAAPGVAYGLTAAAGNALSNYMNRPSQPQQQPQQQGQGAGQAALNAVGGTAGTVAGAAAGKLAAAGAGIGSVLSNPWVWVPVLVAAGTYAIYQGGKWVIRKMNERRAARLKEQGEKNYQQYMQQQQAQQSQAQPQGIGSRLQQFASPNFAPQGV